MSRSLRRLRRLRRRRLFITETCCYKTYLDMVGRMFVLPQSILPPLLLLLLRLPLRRLLLREAPVFCNKHHPNGNDASCPCFITMVISDDQHQA